MERPQEGLQKRTKTFAGAVVRFYIGLDKRRDEIRLLGRELLWSATSVASNHREASRTRCDSDFASKVELCALEADQCQLWLELLQEDCGVARETAEPVWREAGELTAIFTSISKKINERIRETSLR